MLANMLRLLGRPGTILGLVALSVAGAGFAIAANPARDGTVTACVNKKTRAMRLAPSNNRCKRTETKLRFNKQGPRGLPGQDGAPGQPGAQGQPGANAATSVSDAKAGEVTTNSTTPQGKDGPTVTVEVPAGGASLVFGGAFDGKVPGGSFACANIVENGQIVSGFGCSDNAAYERVTSGTVQFADGGTHTYEIRYTTSNASNVASFQNRVFSVSVLR